MLSRPRSFHLGIRGLLTLGLAGLMLTAGVVAAAVVVQLTRAEVEAQTTRQFAVRADHLARLATEICRQPDCGPALVGWVAAQRAREPELLALSIFDTDLRPLAGVARAVDVAGVADVVQGGVAAPQRVTRDADDRWGPGLDVRFARPTSVGGARAVVAVVYALDRALADLDERLDWLLLALAFDFVAVVLFGLYVATRFLVRPMHALTRAVDAIGPESTEGTAVPEVRGPAELHRLAGAFRGMIGRLSAKQAELQATIAELESARGELVRSETLATVGRLAAGVAHEVGNPLSAVVGFVEFLRDATDIDAEMRADLLARTERELRRIRIILRRLLDFSRPGDSVAELVAPRGVAEAAVSLVRFHEALRHATLTVEGDALPVAVDPGRLKQVLVNLLINAGQAAQGAPLTVVVQIAEVADGVHLSVRDDGPGVPEEHVPHIFEPFYTTHGGQGGTGLGLALAQQMVEEAGGRLRFMGPAGGPGAEFRLELPVPIETH